MQITVFSGFSKEHNSTKQPTGGSAVNCYLKDDTSLINPVFILEAANFSINYVQWGSRYYFVDDVVSIRNGAMELHCSVDAMASWKTSIGASSQYVTRSASQSNGRVVDARYPMLAGTDVSIETLSQLDADFRSAGGGTFVVGVIGNGAGTSGITYYAFPNALPSSSFGALLNFLFQGSWLDAPLTEVSLELQKELVNPFQYIASCMWFPMGLTGTSQAVKFGYWTTSVNGMVQDDSIRVRHYAAPFTLPTHPQQSSFGSFVNLSPFSVHTLQVYSFGDVVLDSSIFTQGHTGYVQIDVDIYTGVGMLTVTNDENYEILRTYGQIGVPIQLSQVRSDLIGAGVSAINSVLSLGMFATTASAGALMGTISGVASAVEKLQPKVLSQGTNGSKVAYETPARIVSEFRSLSSPDPEHVGKPLMQRVTISTLSGFIQVENPDVDIAATTAEKDTIAQYMRSGFYYE